MDINLFESQVTQSQGGLN